MSYIISRSVRVTIIYAIFCLIWFQGSITARAYAPPQTLPEIKTPCNCEDTADKKLTGLVWCGVDESLSVQELAELCAPILWFSPDEPLLERGLKVPHLLPCDKPGEPLEAPVVYYRISKIILKSKADQLKLPINQLELSKITGLTLRYYFYYKEDVGFAPHPHDLEGLRFDIRVIQKEDSDDKYKIRIANVLGTAHGISWYDNHLDITDDTSLPITALVEDGKHASCPDRNADGHYTPGYDVNRRYNDAWGVRDIIGAGQLGGVRYDSSMTKPRNPAHKIIIKPEKVSVECLLRSYRGDREELENAVPYKLRRIPDGYKELLQACSEAKSEADRLATIQYKDPVEAKVVAGESHDEIISLAKREKLGDPPVQRGEYSLARKLLLRGFGVQRGQEVIFAQSFSYRYDGNHGLSFLAPLGRYELGPLGGYAVPKINISGFGKNTRISFEALFTPSAARRIDWYAAAGWERFRPEANKGFKDRFASEGGFKLRFPVKFVKFMGLRLGVRAAGFKKIHDPRIIIEFGAGAF